MSIALFNKRAVFLPSIQNILCSPAAHTLKLTKTQPSKNGEREKRNKKNRKVLTVIKYCSLGTASCLITRRLWIIYRMKRIQSDILAQLERESLVKKGEPSFPYVFLRSLKLVAMFLPILITSPLAFINCPKSYILSAWWKITEKVVNHAGPTWIKFMQWLSSRPDMIPLHICVRLSRFQANCETHSFNDTLRILKRTVNIDETFSYINPIPVASGSMGQVYEATLRSPLGHFFDSKVALKVVHPRVSKPVKADLKILSGLKNVFVHLPFFGSLPLTEAFVSFREQMLNHLDLRREAVNLCKFNANFSSIFDRCFKFPKPFRGLTEKSFVVESFERGVPIAKIADSRDTKLKATVARLCMDGFLKMMFRDNFMHMDLHPGNILVDNKHKYFLSPSVVFLDPGLTATLSKEKLKNFCEMCYLVSSKRSREAAEMMIDRGPKGTKCSQKQRGKFKYIFKILFA